MTDEQTATDTRLGLIRVEGADAADFLRAQLTNDVLRLGPDRHFLAAWCDAKGRVQMITRVVALPDQAFLLVVPRSLIAATMRRLRMYVLRLAVTLSDQSDALALHGRLDDAEAPAPDVTVTHGETRLLGLPATADGVARTLVIGPAAAGDLDTNDARWQLAGIDAGVPQIEAASQGEFVPQMLNLHWLMALDFDKGCYPGQEVIARLQYRGRLTRRLFRMSYEGACPTHGSPLTTDAGERAGMVLQAAPTGDAGGRLLGVVAVNAIDAPIHTEHGPARLLDLPYATPDPA